MNKLDIEKMIIEITRITGLLVEEIQWDQEINIENMKALVDDLQKQSEKLHKLLG